LTNIVNLIQQRFGTDVCSVYLLEPDRSSLVLAATVGLRPESVGRVRMRLTEGLVGLVAQRMRPLMVEDATRHPRFKYFRERDDDGLPRHWIARMKRAISTLGWRFSADRMVMDYVLKAYIPAAGGTSSDVRSS
jgi:signal transduction protein with GAF and PtsI domain